VQELRPLNLEKFKISVVFQTISVLAIFAAISLKLGFAAPV
jgi:hypothetical protein